MIKGSIDMDARIIMNMYACNNRIKQRKVENPTTIFVDF